MNRPASPILHDYKPSAGLPVKNFDALHWFAVGLGLPLIGIALLLLLKNASGTDAAVIEDEVAVAMVEKAEHGAALPVAIVAELPEELVAEPIPFPPFHPPLELPADQSAKVPLPSQDTNWK